MTILLYVVLALVGMYLLVKIGLFFYRPIVINKAMLEIKDGFARAMKAHDEEINRWMKHLENYREGKDAETVHFSSEDEISKRIKDAADAKEHERDVYEKFVKLRERSLNDKNKFAEAMFDGLVKSPLTS